MFKKGPSLSLASDLGEAETLGALLDGFQQIVSQLVVGLKKKPLQLQKIQYVLWMRDIFVQIRHRIRTSDQWIRIRLRILLFSAVTFKRQQKKLFFL